MATDVSAIEAWVSKEMQVKKAAILAYLNSGDWGRAAMRYVVKEQLEMTLRGLAKDKAPNIAPHSIEEIAQVIKESKNEDVHLIYRVLEDIYGSGKGAAYAAKYISSRAK
jgi:hypothetical protein